MRIPRASSAVLILAASLTLAACSPQATAPSDTPTSTPTAAESEGPTPRLAFTYDGGLLVVDATTGEVAADLPLDGFNRINPAGNDRHVVVSTEGGFAALDTGTWTEAHGDHGHSFTGEPSVSDVLVSAEKPGHAIPHDGLTALWDDATGKVVVVESEKWAEAMTSGTVTPVREYSSPDAHHGLAVASQDGTMLVSDGDSEDRHSAMLIDGSDDVIVRNEDCPGLHGETVAQETTYLVGCENGSVVFSGKTATKISSPDEFGRIGNLFAAEDSSVVLGDYKTDPEGGIGLSAVSLIDLEKESITVVPLEVQYTWRDLARGDNGEVLVYGTDGVLQVLDPATGASQRTIKVADAWEVPEEWQTAHPAVMVLEGMAYVTDPATQTLHIVDYAGGEVWKSIELPHVPNEMVGVTG